MNKNRRCPHTKNSGATATGMVCSICSKIRMVFMLTHEYKNDTNTKTLPYFYNKLKHNKLSSLEIVEIMKKELMNDSKYFDYYQNSNWVNFYEKGVKHPIHQHKP